MDFMDWINNAPIVQLQLENWTYFTGLGPNEFWGSMGAAVLSSLAPTLSSLSSAMYYF